MKFAFLFSIFMVLTVCNVQAVECGRMGSIQERVQDCSNQFVRRASGWKLITRTPEHFQIWLAPNDIIWGETLDEEMNHHQALRACEGYMPQNGSLSFLHFRLPTHGEYQEALAMGLSEVLEHEEIPGAGYWTSSFVDYDLWEAWQYSFSLNGFKPQDRDMQGKIRCIAKFK